MNKAQTLSAASRALGCPARRNTPLVARFAACGGKASLIGRVSPLPKKLLAFRGPLRAEARTHFYKRKGKVIKMENRKRNITLSIRLTAEEKEALTKKASDADLSMTDYILRCSSRKKIRVLNMSKVIVELKRIGNNLNQITRRINSGDFTSYNFSGVIEEQRKLYDLILSMMGDD